MTAAHAATPPPGRPGAYGIALRSGTLPPQTWQGLQQAPQAWPTWTVDRAPQLSEAPTIASEIAKQGWCHLELFHGGSATMTRADQRVVLRLRDAEPPGSIVHPWMSGVFAVALHWQGGFALHGGVCVIDGRAWVLFGEKGAGKSTTLAALAGAGITVLADDMAAILSEQVLTGPRYVDLRQAAAAGFPAAEPVGRLGLRHRWRLPLPPAPTSVPLAGWAFLEWADALEAETVPVQERLQLLLSFGNSPFAPQQPRDALALVDYPMLRVRRPRQLGALGDWVVYLQDTLAASAR